MTDLEQFVKDFDIRSNALQMRTLARWNGRDLRTEENLAEHTHLVTACAIYLYDKFAKTCDFEKVIRLCMHHDALEILRGDILSITKDAIPGLRAAVDDEESVFLNKLVGEVNDYERDLVKLADLMACYKFVQWELRYPSNDYAYYAYKNTLDCYNRAYLEFCDKYNIKTAVEKAGICNKLTKGYANDAGVDVILEQPAMFMPHSTTQVELNVTVTPDENEMAVLCARTSAASKGLNVAMCPIDPDFTGKVTAIVHNISNDIILYNAGEAFCQIVGLKLAMPTYSDEITIKKTGKRSNGKLGSTGGVK